MHQEPFPSASQILKPYIYRGWCWSPGIDEGRESGEGKGKGRKSGRGRGRGGKKYFCFQTYGHNCSCELVYGRYFLFRHTVHISEL